MRYRGLVIIWLACVAVGCTPGLVYLERGEGAIAKGDYELAHDNRVKAERALRDSSEVVKAWTSEGYRNRIKALEARSIREWPTPIPTVIPTQSAEEVLVTNNAEAAKRELREICSESVERKSCEKNLVSNPLDSMANYCFLVATNLSSELVSDSDDDEGYMIRTALVANTKDARLRALLMDGRQKLLNDIKAVGESGCVSCEKFAELQYNLLSNPDPKNPNARFLQANFYSAAGAKVCKAEGNDLFAARAHLLRAATLTEWYKRRSGWSEVERGLAGEMNSTSAQKIKTKFLGRGQKFSFLLGEAEREVAKGARIVPTNNLAASRILTGLKKVSEFLSYQSVIGVKF